MLPRQLQRVPGWTAQLWGDPCDVRQQRTGAVAKSPRCHRAPTSIRQAAPSVCREGPSLASLLRIGLTIDAQYRTYHEHAADASSIFAIKLTPFFEQNRLVTPALVTPT